MDEQTTERDEQEKAGESVEEKIGRGDVLDEVGAVARRFGSAFEKLLGGDRRKQLQRRMIEELRTAGERLERMATDEETKRKLKEGLTKNAERLGRVIEEGVAGSQRNAKAR